MSEDLSYLAKQNTVKASIQNFKFIGIAIGLALIFFIFLLLIFKYPPRGSNISENSSAKYLLEKSPNLNHSIIPINSANPNPNSNSNSNPSSRTILARENAPTEMYAVIPSDQNHSDLINSEKIQHPESTIAQGELLEGSLETAINSDLPGSVRAVLTRPVYSYTHLNLLIPAGSRLIGQYTSIGSNGAATDRVFIIWNRLITPSGLSLIINSPGGDSLGRSGMGADLVDTHFWKIFGTAALLSVMGAAVSTEGVNAEDQPNSADAYRQSISSALNTSTQKVLSRNENIQPTLHIHQGDKISIFVAHDLDLSKAVNAGEIE